METENPIGQGLWSETTKKPRNVKETNKGDLKRTSKAGEKPGCSRVLFSL